MLLSADSFNRADSSTSLGATDGNGLLDPLTWVDNSPARGGPAGISTNQAYDSTAGNLLLATIDLGTADVDLFVTLSVLDNEGLTFRCTDVDNCWVLRIGGPQLQLTKRVSGTGTLVANPSIGTPANGDEMRVIVLGSSIVCRYNGATIITTSDAYNSTVTTHGLCFGDTNVGRLDDWKAYAA